MLHSLLLGNAIFLCFGLMAQSTDDVRFTFGEGPYPLYMSGSLGLTGSKYLFRDFAEDYTKKEGRRTLYSWEINLGSAINCRHCLAIKNIHIRNFAVEISYMTAARRLNIDSGHALQLVESNGSFRIIYRYTKLYPLTLQVHFGPNIYSFYQIRKVIQTDSASSVQRLRIGSSILENNQGEFARLFPGYNFRLRIALFDPTGVGSGFGLFSEYSIQGKWRKDNLATAYDYFELIPSKLKDRHRNFGHFSCGIVVPLALKIY